MTWAELSVYFDRIQELSGRIEITRVLAQVFSECRPREAEIISYLTLGQLRPTYHGTQFNIARNIAR